MLPLPYSMTLASGLMGGTFGYLYLGERYDTPPAEEPTFITASLDFIKKGPGIGTITAIALRALSYYLGIAAVLNGIAFSLFVLNLTFVAATAIPQAIPVWKKIEQHMTLIAPIAGTALLYALFNC